MSQGISARGKKLLVTSWVCEEGPLFKPAEDEGIEIVMARRPAFRGEAEMVELVKSSGGIDGVVAASDAYTAVVMDACAQVGHSLQVVSRVGVGYDSVDLKAANSRKIAVCTTPGANQDSVADHTMALLLSIARGVGPMDKAVHENKWLRISGADVFQKTIGILGLGKIGKGVARRASGFDMKIVAYDPFWDEEFAQKYGVERLEMDEVIRQADFLTLHLPASSETNKIMDARRLALLKPTAYLINAARGTLIDEAALTNALKAKKFAGAALDVFENEPPWGSPLFGVDNIIMTGHAAGFSVNANEAMAKMAIANALLVLKGEKPLYSVNPNFS